jgi:putative FmdB family regulatory protein
MPIYEYICDNCGHRFESLRSINDDSGMHCLKCNNNARRIYSSVPFIFGGTRWVGEIKKESESSLKDKTSSDKSKTVKTEC